MTLTQRLAERPLTSDELIELSHQLARQLADHPWISPGLVRSESITVDADGRVGLGHGDPEKEADSQPVIHAFGEVVFHMATGHLHRVGEQLDPQVALQVLSPEFLSLVNRALGMTPEKPFESLDALVSHLDAARLASHGVEASLTSKHLSFLSPSGEFASVQAEEAQAADFLSHETSRQLPHQDGSASRRVARNTMVMLGSQVVTFALSFVWTVLIQHTLGDANVGRLFTAQSLAWIGLVFMDAGVCTYLVKQVARNKEQTAALLGAAFGLRLIAGALVYGCIIAGGFLLGYDTPTMVAASLLGAAAVAGALVQVTAAAFQGHEEMKWPALGTITEKTVLTLFTVLLIVAGYRLVGVAGVLLAGAVANLAVVGSLAARRGWIRVTFDPRMMKKLLVGGAPFFLWASFGVIYQRNSALQLASMTDPATTGHFGVATRMYETLSFVPYIFQTAVMPVLARTFVHATDNMQRTSRRSFDLILMAAFPIGVGVAMLAPEIICLVSDRTQFGDSVTPLRILGLSLIPLYVDMILAMILISADRQKHWGFVAVMAALFNPLLNWWLIPLTHHQFQNGAIGAALVTMITEVVIFFVYASMVPKGILGRSTLLIAAKLFAAVVCMGASLWVLIPWFHTIAPSAGISKMGATVVLLLSAFSGALVYFAVAWLLRAIHVAEVELLRRSLAR